MKYLFSDAAIFIEIIQTKGPAQSLGDGPTQDVGQANHKVLQPMRNKRENTV